jgi:hypothetical protein
VHQLEEEKKGGINVLCFNAANEAGLHIDKTMRLRIQTLPRDQEHKVYYKFSSSSSSSSSASSSLILFFRISTK